MKEGWRSVSTMSGEPFAVGQDTTAGELQMEELSVNNWDTKNLASLCVACSKQTVNQVLPITAVHQVSCDILKRVSYRLLTTINIWTLIYKENKVL